jgi:hypothetical protein
LKALLILAIDAICMAKAKKEGGVIWNFFSSSCSSDIKIRLFVIERRGS